MLEAVPRQFAPPMRQDSPSQAGRAACASRMELTQVKSLSVTDSTGNTKLVRQTVSMQVVQNQSPAGPQIAERNIVRQNPQTSCAFKAPSFLAIAVTRPILIGNAAHPFNVVCRALPDRSIAALLPMSQAVHVFIPRSDLAENSSTRIVVEMLSKVAQLVAFLADNGLIDVRQGQSEGRPASQVGNFFSTQPRSVDELLGGLINILRMHGGAEDSQKGMDLSRLERKLSLALKDATSLSDPAFLQELDSLCNQYIIAAEQQGVAININRQGFSELFNPKFVNAPVAGTKHDGLSVPARSGASNAHHGEHGLKNGERPVPPGNNSAHKPVPVDSGIKAGVNSIIGSVNNNAAPISSNQVTGLLSQLLAASGLANVAAQPLAMESGPKQLPPIILPNVHPGNRSDKRRKSRKELKEEEEKEREDRKGFFMFDDEPFESFDDE